MVFIIEKTKNINKTVDERISENKLAEDKRAIEFSTRYFQRIPLLSPLFDSSMYQVLSCNNELATNLASFRKIHMSIEEAYFSIKRKLDALEVSQKLTISYLDETHIQTIYEGAQQANQIGQKIIELLTKLVLKQKI